MKKQEKRNAIKNKFTLAVESPIAIKLFTQL